MTRRILAIFIAIALAALGTAGGVYLVVTADQRAQARLANPVEVLIANRAIPAGTTGQRVRTMVRIEKLPAEFVPDDALSAISDDLEDQVVTSTIAAGQILLRANFGSRSQVASVLPVPEGKMAVTVATGAPEQVAGYVQPGAQVAIFLTYDVVDKQGRRTGIERTRLLLPRVDVLATGTYDPSDGDRTARTTTRGGSLMVTVAVTQQEAERLIQGLSHGTLYLGLLSDSTEVRTGSGVDNTDQAGGTVPLFR